MPNRGKDRPTQALATHAKRVEQYMRTPWDQKGADGFQMVCLGGFPWNSTSSDK